MQLFFSLLCILIGIIGQCESHIFPIQFGIPESKIAKEIPQKKRDFAFIIPGRLETYIYDNESDYYKGYQDSYFAITHKKGGWDCMRHYEILANGCIPYFVNLEQCNPSTMIFLPKELIKEAMKLAGVSYLNINHHQFDKSKYYDLLNRLLEHTRTYLSTKAIARYILDTIHYTGQGKILYLSNEISPDYLRETVLIGLKELLGDRIIDTPKIDYLYKSYLGNIKMLYGKGITYTKVLDDLSIDRSNIEKRIGAKEFDLIIYGSVHRGLPFHELVTSIYDENHIIYLCGEDDHKCTFTHLHNLFLREFDAL